MNYIDLTPNQTRVAVDAKQTFEAYRVAHRAANQYRGGMTWKKVGGREYLVKIIDRTGGSKGLGPRSAETERIYEGFVAGKARAKEREAALAKSVHEFAAMSRAVGINRVPAIVAAALRKLDEFGLLGKSLMVIGTNAMYGYESAAGVMFSPDLMATSDIDFLWDARAGVKFAVFDGEVAEAGVLAILRKVDKTFEPLYESGFRAVNKAGFFVDLVKQAPNPPWKAGEPEKIADRDLVPSWLQNIKWLLSSEKFMSTVIGQDGLPAPMVSPDPRAFAVYKAWLSQQNDRDPEKKHRDRLQAIATRDLVLDRFPHLPFDEDAQRMFPAPVRKPLSGFSL